MEENLNVIQTQIEQYLGLLTTLYSVQNFGSQEMYKLFYFLENTPLVFQHPLNFVEWMVEFVKTLVGHHLGQVVFMRKSNVVPLVDCYQNVANFIKSKLLKEELNL